MNNIKPTMLIIMDGFGLNPDTYGNAIKAAKTPNLDEIFKKYPMTSLEASGLKVGLPEGQMGNSEVGHLNIGAGRIIYQDLTEITKSIEDGDFFNNRALLSAIDHVKENHSALHIFGLLSDGGVHSHIEHIKAILDLAKANKLPFVYLHCFMDGRDVPPTSGINYIKEIEDYMSKINLGEIGLVSGRYYAMDRDKRWERVEQAYDALTVPTIIKATDGSTACALVQASYDCDVTDEFILPSMCSKHGCIKDGDSIIFANFRPDRAREITRAFVDPAFDGFERKVVIKNLKYVCMTEYDSTMPNVEIAFPPQTVKNTLGEYVSKLGLKQLRIAETEKYAHVTFFFNGGVEAPNKNEDRILIPSPKVATYDMQPEMSAYDVTNRVKKEIEADKYDLIILNFANSDMVGHTGVFDAAVKAIETLDSCVKSIVDLVLEKGGQILLTADHGNSDVMLDANGAVVTAHSTNPVPLVHIAKDPREFKGQGKLADIAPTLLTLMGISVPDEMNGEVLV